MEKTQLARVLREASYVRRLHTVPIHGEQTVAHHSWNMAALLYALHPTASKELIWACLMHDAHERFLGDTPSPAKWWINDDLGAQLFITERMINTTMGLEFDLSGHEREWLTCLDVLELYLFCQDQMSLGNWNMANVSKACHTFLTTKRCPQEILTFMGEYSSQRTDDTCGINAPDAESQQT